jgi:peptide/nickel transport system substrate-binding protein
VQRLQSSDFQATFGNVTRADPDILRTAYWSAGPNWYRLPVGPLDDLLLLQAAAANPAAHSALIADAQRLIVENYYSVPVAELPTVLGVGATTHGVRFDASSRIHLYDTWKSA